MEINFKKAEAERGPLEISSNRGIGKISPLKEGVYGIGVDFLPKQNQEEVLRDRFVFWVSKTERRVKWLKDG